MGETRRRQSLARTVATADQASPLGELVRNFFLGEMARQCVPTGGRVANAKLLGDGLFDAAAAHIGQRALTDGRADLGPVKARRQIVQPDHLGALGLALAIDLLLAGRARLRQIDATPLGQVARHLDEPLAVELAQEAEDVARFAAAEAVVKALLGVDVEGRALLLMERAQPLVVDAAPTELHVFADDLHDVRAVADLGDLVLRDQPQLLIRLMNLVGVACSSRKKDFSRTKGGILGRDGGESRTKRWAARNTRHYGQNGLVRQISARQKFAITAGSGDRHKMERELDSELGPVSVAGVAGERPEKRRRLRDRLVERDEDVESDADRAA